MGYSASDVVPFTPAHADLSELADRLDDSHRLERERIHLLLIADAQRGLADIEAGRNAGADDAIAKRQKRHACGQAGG